MSEYIDNTEEIDPIPSEDPPSDPFDNCPVPDFPEFLEELPEDEEDPQVDEYTIERKYVLTDETRILGANEDDDDIDIEDDACTVLYRIKACRSFGNVYEDDLGGFVESELNLSHEGTCWIYDDAMVMEDGAVYHHAAIRGGATVKGSATVMDHAEVKDYATVDGDSVIEQHAVVQDYAWVSGNASVTDTALIKNHAFITDNVRVAGSSIVQDFTFVRGDTWLQGNTYIYGSSGIYTDATLDGYTRLYAKHTITDSFNSALFAALADLHLTEKDYPTPFDFWKTDFAWKIRQGKPFQFIPEPVTNVSKIEIARAPLEMTEAEDFDPLLLFYPELMNPSVPPDVPEDSGNEEPVEPPVEDDTPVEPPSDNPDESEEFTGGASGEVIILGNSVRLLNDEEEGTPIDDEDDPTLPDDETDPEPDNPDDPPAEPTEPDPDNPTEPVSPDVPTDVPTEPDEPVEVEPYPYGLFTKDDIFTVDEPTVYYIKVSSSDTQYRLYSVAFTPVPYGLLITVSDPDEDMPAHMHEITDHEKLNLAQVWFVKAQPSYKFDIRAFEPSKTNVYVRVVEDLETDFERSPKPYEPRTAWIKADSTFKLLTDDEHSVTVATDDYRRDVQIPDEEPMELAFLNTISFGCRVEDGRMLRYDYLIEKPELRAKPDNDLTNREVTDPVGGRIAVWPANGDTGIIGQNLRAYRASDLDNPPGEKTLSNTSEVLFRAEAMRDCKYTVSHLVGPTNIILDASDCYGNYEDSIYGRLLAIADHFSISYSDLETGLGATLDTIAHDGFKLNDALGMVFALYMSARNIVTAVTMLSAIHEIGNEIKDQENIGVTRTKYLAITKGVVNLFDKDGNVKSLKAILTELANLCTTLPDEEVTELTYEICNKNTSIAEIFKVLMNNWGMVTAVENAAFRALPIPIPYEYIALPDTGTILDDQFLEVKVDRTPVYDNRPVLGFAVTTSVDVLTAPDQTYLYFMPRYIVKDEEAKQPVIDKEES